MCLVLLKGIIITSYKLFIIYFFVPPTQLHYRYVRSLLSHESFSSSLPHKDSLLRLVDTYILKLPSTDKIKNNLPLKWPFNVYEELELLDLLRLQIEERQSMEVQLALFDTMFGLVGREKQVRNGTNLERKESSLLHSDIYCLFIYAWSFYRCGMV